MSILPDAETRAVQDAIAKVQGLQAQLKKADKAKSAELVAQTLVSLPGPQHPPHPSNRLLRVHSGLLQTPGAGHHQQQTAALPFQVTVVQ